MASAARRPRLAGQSSRLCGREIARVFTRVRACAAKYTHTYIYIHTSASCIEAWLQRHDARRPRPAGQSTRLGGKGSTRVYVYARVLVPPNAFTYIPTYILAPLVEAWLERHNAPPGCSKLKALGFAEEKVHACLRACACAAESLNTYIHTSASCRGMA